MSTNSNLLLFLVTLQTILFAGLCTASTTLLITGHSSNNIYKYAFAQKFASQVELDRAHGADLIQISSEEPRDLIASEDGLLLRTIGGVPMAPGNLSRIVVSRLGSEEMSLDHIQVLWQFIDSDEPLIVVEIGEQSVQTRALLNKGAVCWGQARAAILSPNLAYLCNDVSPEMVQKIVEVESIRNLDAETRVIIDEPHARPFWPSLFASAAKTERKNRKRQAQEVIEVEDDVEEIVDQIMENIEKAEEKQASKSAEKPVAKKLSCKYRKSCYESGEKPTIESISSFDWDGLTSWFNFEKEEKKYEDDDDEKEDLTPKKLKCKYRLDCYKKKGIQLTGKDGEREERKSLLAGKSLPQQGKKRTLKEIAEKTIKNVKVAEEKAASRPLPTSVIAERKLNEIEEKLTEKLQCKYRKSCYETGDLPVIESGIWSMPVFSTHSAQEAVEEVDFKEMEDLEKKVFCKYRKSCYETGVKPEIEPDIQIHSFSDLGELPEIIETRKLTLQEKCKYRKSCYETGILPEINPQLETVIQKEVSNVIPSNVNELKKFCKYRKSCYEELAQSSASSVDAVKNIRKRRMIEKEVKRRKMRRARMRRRLAAGIELESIGARTRTRNRRYTTQPNETTESVSPPVVKPTKKQTEEESEPAKTKTKNPKPEPVEEVIPETIKVKKVKSPPKPEPTPETIEESEPVKSTKPVEEAIPEPIKVKKVKSSPKLEPAEELEEVNEPPKQQKKKVKKPEPEPEKELPPPVVKTIKKQPKKEEAESEVEPEVKPKKSQKKSGKKEEPVPVKATRKAEESEEKELTYKEEKKLQMYCKYRKSCYETKERPVIDQTLSTLYDKFDSHVNEHYESLEKKELSETDKKLACKYRKTCYETKVRPVIDSSFSIWGEPVTVSEDDEDDEEKEINLENLHKEEERKLACKYRKSCYETNKRPVIAQSFASIWGGTIQQEEPRDMEESWHSVDNKKLGCKYRKSCYDRKGYDFGDGEEKEEVKKKEESKKEVKKESKVVVKEVKKEKKEAPKPKELPKKQEQPKKKESAPKKEESHEDKENNEEETKREIEDLPELDRGQKLHCKYRKSCYLNAPKNETPTRTIRVNGGLPQRVKCNEYYLSCREQMGLPPKEKAPIGPSGRKLCRKKKAN